MSNHECILALDLGLTTGWAVTMPGGGIASGTMYFHGGRFEGGGMVWIRFAKWLREMHEASTIARVAFEEVRAHKGTGAAHIYGGFLAHLTAFCEANGVPYEGIPVGTIKRHVTGRGNADKESVITAVRDLGFDPADHNEADALALLNYIMSKDLPPGKPSFMEAMR